jgi:hypothetical protein
MSPGFEALLAASTDDRRDAFIATGRRLGTAEQNVEKDFWVCWTLDALFHALPQGSPRLLFKGGTSLSKCYGLISRFSEDIDVTVFREDLHEPATVEALEKLSGKKRQAKLDAIRAACREYIGGLSSSSSVISCATVWRAPGSIPWPAASKATLPIPTARRCCSGIPAQPRRQAAISGPP